jgi:hypothetical protein
LRPTRDDATDSLALVQAVRRGDERAIAAVLTSANVPAMARALATVLPRAVRTQGVSVDAFLHSLTDGVISASTPSAPADAHSTPILDVPAACASIAEPLRCLLAAIEAGELAAEHWQVGWLVGAISALTTAGGGVSNRFHIEALPIGAPAGRVPAGR